MSNNLTAAQVEALQKIADNPNKVSTLGASHDSAKGLLTIHGRTSTSLYARGYIEGFNPETGRNFHDEGESWYSGKYFWRLTAAGREALGILENLSPTAQAVAEASIIRDQAMMAAFKAEGTSRERDMDLAYEEADAAYYEAKRLHRLARVAAGDNTEPIPERCIQRGGVRGEKSLPCIRDRHHTGDCKNGRGERFTNWLDPNDLKR